MSKTAYSKETVSVIVSDADTPTGFPFNYSREDFLAELEYHELRELIAEVDNDLWLALKHAERPDGTRALIEHQLEAKVSEIERRQRLLKARQHDPLRPTWPKSDASFKARVAAVKDRWPITRFCRELLVMELIADGTGKWKARCPLPGHEDKTPSFKIDETKNVAFCHGCQRGGDVLKLTQFMLNLERFTDAVRRLDREGGTT